MIDNIKKWLIGARPKTLTAAIVPFLVGAALSYSQGNKVNWPLLILCWLTALLLQAGTNLVNDALDFESGVDTDERIGPTRLSLSGMKAMNNVYKVGVGCLLMAFIAALPIIYAGGVQFLLIILASIAAGYLYTGGPYPLSKLGLAEVVSFLFFGVIATMASYRLQSGNWSFDSFIAGCQVGSLTAVISSINNLRDRLQDLKAGKYTLSGRFGEVFGRYQVAFFAVLPFVIGFYWLFKQDYVAALLPLSLIPLASSLIKSVLKTPIGPIFNQYLGMGALLHLLFGVALSLGFWWKFAHAA